MERMSNECRCGRPTRDVAYVCETCCEELKVALGDIPELEEELTVTITRQRGKAIEGNGSASASCSCKDDEVDKCQHSLIPWHEKAADVQRNLKSMLVLWVRFCSEERVRHKTHPLAYGPIHERCTHASCERILRGDYPTDTLASMSGWLLWRVDGLALRDIGPDAYDEITDAIADCRRIIDRNPDRVPYGQCLTEDCKERLYGIRGHHEVTCKHCGSTYNTEELRAWLLDQAEDREVDAATLGRALSWWGEPIPAATIRSWIHRGRLLAARHIEGRPVYRIGDALNVLHDTDSNKSA